LDWIPTEPGGPDLVPHGPGTAQLEVEVPHPGRYGFYVQGSARNRLGLVLDGVEIGSVREQLNESRQFLYFGDALLGAGIHEIELVYDGKSLAPGSGGPPEAIGPLVLGPVANEDPPLIRRPSSAAGTLCGKRLDWVEALP
jgi:hypothetical protein